VYPLARALVVGDGQPPMLQLPSPGGNRSPAQNRGFADALLRGRIAHRGAFVTQCSVCPGLDTTARRVTRPPVIGSPS
jgi:hypothetical protein